MNDKDITFADMSKGGSGGPTPFGRDNDDYVYGAFKDGIYYACLRVNRMACPKITIPSSVEDTESAYISYATSIINSYLKSYNEEQEENASLIKIEKADRGYYKIYYKWGQEYCLFQLVNILKRMEGL